MVNERDLNNQRGLLPRTPECSEATAFAHPISGVVL